MSPTGRFTRTLTVAGLMACLAACSAPPASAPPATPSPSTSTQASTTEPLNAAEQLRVVDRAETFLRALVEPGASRNVWWAGVQPHLTSTAAKRLGKLEPSSVGFARVLGSGQLLPAPTDQETSRTVIVPTDAGLMEVQVADPTGTPLVDSYGPEGAASGSPSVTTSAQSPSQESGLSAEDEADLKKFATTFMKAFAKPAAGVSSRQWWERIAGMLTDDAVDAYAGITPAVVPVHRVTGPVGIEPLEDPDSDGFWLRTVSVGTDAGVYKLIVQLPSSGLSDRMLVVEIQEP